MSEIINEMFPNGMNAEVISTILVYIYAIIMAFYNLTIKKKVIKSDIQENNSSVKATEAKEASKNTADAVKVLANMMLTIFLNANTLDETQKKQLVKYANVLDEISGIELDDKIHKIMDVITKYNPEASIIQQKETLVNAAEKAEKIIDDANQKTKELLDKLEV